MTGRNGARVLIEGADAALHGLLEEWLSEQGWRVVPERPDLVLADLPRSRQGAEHLIARLRHRHPGVPLLALASNLVARIEANGAVARDLGVDALLPKPLEREALGRTLVALLAPPE